QIDQIGIQHVAFAVGTDSCKFAPLVGIPDVSAVHANFSGETEQSGDVAQTGAPAALKAGQNIHQIHVTPMESAEVIAVSKAGVVIAGLPISRRSDAVQQAPI